MIFGIFLALTFDPLDDFDFLEYFDFNFLHSLDLFDNAFEDFSNFYSFAQSSGQVKLSGYDAQVSPNLEKFISKGKRIKMIIRKTTLMFT